MKRTALLVLVLAAACGTAPTTATSLAAAPSLLPTPTPTATPTPATGPALRLTPAWSPLPYSPVPVPHFDSPESMFVFLADAWNRGDLGSVNRVTDPGARDLLWNMHREATNLRLEKCTYDAGQKDYQCSFTHDYPIGYQGQPSASGIAVFRAGPARRTGWYMTYYETCG